MSDNAHRDVVYLADEPFNTFQGEGPYTGHPALFIRFWGCNFHCSWCFPGDTPVLMTDETYKPIAAVKVGDFVLSYNQETCGFEEDRVVNVMSREEKNNLYGLVLLSVNGSQEGCVIEATEDHEFMTHAGWKRMKDIQVNDRIVGYFGSLAVTAKHKTVGKQVFNIETNKNHTYVAHGAVVHNCDTKYSWETTTDRTPYEYTKILEYIDQYPNSLVILTGGEPVLQRKTIARLCADRPERQFQIETNGSLPPTELTNVPNLVFIVSPKLSSSGNTHKYKKEITEQYNNNPNTAFKFVADAYTQTEIEKFVLEQGITAPVYIMPEGRSAKEVMDHMADIWEWALSRGFRLTSRLHVLAFGAKRSV